jgi:glutamine synthetase
MNKRIFAINKIADLQPASIQPAPAATGEPASSNVAYFGEDVFNKTAIEKYLPHHAAEKLLDTIEHSKVLDTEIAADVAAGMKQWALDRGATHYTHWFQPLTGSTAEKHDSFLEPKGDHAVFTFSAKNLIMGEPDASSFPSGGLRRTFEARGYTAWDPTSPAFIKRHANGATLCIPTIFYSFTGEALDKKTPLLRSTQALSAAVKRLMHCFGLADEKVSVYMGPEQEYFLIDKHLYIHRTDLLQTGRTLFGATPAKHQQLEDHYFGTIKQRVLNFMTDVENSLWRLGIPAKTRHNETAPAQFELAPMFEDLNLAVDHNMLTMDVLRTTANKHGLVCLLHEKPFKGINGSGKHNNWSIGYGGINLFNPGSNPHQNAIFLTMLCSVIKAIDEHSDMLRMTVASAGNDHRLGAQEAPPAIISIYLGDQLNDVIQQLESGAPKSSRSVADMKVGIDTLPPLPMDVTDRNRTSPFAFTGNKFEFRAPGSSQSCAGPMAVLNTITADSIDWISDQLERVSKEDFNATLQHILQSVITKHKRVLFNGDGYTQEWREEAKRRGMFIANDTMSALRVLTAEKNVKLFGKYGVYSEKELHSRYEIFMEEYHRRIRIEGEISLDMARNLVLPVLVKEYRNAVEALHAADMAEISAGKAAMEDLATTYGTALDELSTNIAKMVQATQGLHEEILEAMTALRATVDRIERLVADELWPMPKYREMLFIY